MFNFAKYGYKIERATQKSATATKVDRPVRRSNIQQLGLLEDHDAPRPEADTVVALI